MADNITAPAAGAVLATDDIGGVHYPYAKLAWGANDTATPVADANGARLPVLIYVPAGQQIGLDAATLAALENIGVTITGPLPAGTNNIGIVALDAATLAALENITVTGPLTDAQLRAAAVPVSLASAPLPTGASTEATLAALNAKLAALESGRAPVAVQALATATRRYAYAAGQRLTTSGAGQVRSTAVAATEVLLHASVRGFFRVGDNAVAATVGAGSIPLEAGEKFHLQIASGEFISFIRDGSTDGSLTIMPVA